METKNPLKWKNSSFINPRISKHASGKYLPEDVVMDVVLLGRLRRQHKGLHKPPHWLAVVGQLPRDLDHHSGGKGGVGVHLHYFKTYVNIINI